MPFGRTPNTSKKGKRECLIRGAKYFQKGEMRVSYNGGHTPLKRGLYKGETYGREKYYSNKITVDIAVTNIPNP